MDENIDTWNMIMACAPFLLRPGGVDPAGVDLLLRRYRIDYDEEPELIDKIMAYAAEAIAAAEEKNKK